MPEGPLVQQETDMLQAALFRDGKWMRFYDFIVYNTRYGVNIDDLIPSHDQPIVDIFCKGKNFFILLANNITIRAHHMMGGMWAFEKDPKHTHFELTFKDEQGEVKVYYINTRFGEFEILTDATALETAVDKLASGFIGKFQLTKEQWMQKKRNFTKRKMLRTALMDQKELCSGIGNYLLAEILYEAKFHPDIKFGDISDEQFAQLYDICKEKVQGFYENRLEKVIYKRQTSPNGNPVIGGNAGTRTMWYCPAEQLIGA